jgi:hypothetical protein
LEIAPAVTAAVFAILVITRPSQLYPWLKALHVIAIIPPCPVLAVPAG